MFSTPAPLFWEGPVSKKHMTTAFFPYVLGILPSQLLDEFVTCLTHPLTRL